MATTPQSIREKTFEKAVFGGYDMAGVDDFLESIANDFAAMQKDSSVLKSKMKVLVDKIEEYRSTEEAMRMALLSAQKMANQVTEEAKSTGEAILATSKAEADRLLHEARVELYLEEARLLEAKQASAEYLEQMRLLSVKHLDFLDALSAKENVVTTPAPQQRRSFPVPIAEPDEAAVRSIESRVAHLAEDVAPALDVHLELGGVESVAEDGNPTRHYGH